MSTQQNSEDSQTEVNIKLSMTLRY